MAIGMKRDRCDWQHKMTAWPTHPFWAIFSIRFQVRPAPVVVPYGLALQGKMPQGAGMPGT
jgi:hypothetical protein